MGTFFVPDMGSPKWILPLNGLCSKDSCRGAMPGAVVARSDASWVGQEKVYSTIIPISNQHTIKIRHANLDPLAAAFWHVVQAAKERAAQQRWRSVPLLHISFGFSPGHWGVMQDSSRLLDDGDVKIGIANSDTRASLHVLSYVQTCWFIASSLDPREGQVNNHFLPLICTRYSWSVLLLWLEYHPNGVASQFSPIYSQLWLPVAWPWCWLSQVKISTWVFLKP